MEGGSPFALGLSAYGGLTALFGVDIRGAYSVAGGMLRARYGYVTAGGYYELSDSPDQRSGEWWGAGGFAGAWLPYGNWVDFEVALRAGLRQFTDADVKYGPDGYGVGGPTLGLLLGVSDRSPGMLGGRIGGGFIATYDLTQHDEAWRQETYFDTDEAPIVSTGVSHIGGLSVGLFVELGLELQP